MKGSGMKHICLIPCRFGTKVGLGVGVVYATVDQGIWGSSREAAAAYDRLYDIMPGTKNVSEKVRLWAVSGFEYCTGRSLTLYMWSHEMLDIILNSIESHETLICAQMFF